MPKLKVPGLDAVRFATAFIVMLFHLCYWHNGRVAPDSDAFDAAWWFGWVGVQIFFTISGFVIAFSAEGASSRKFALSRAVRLVPMVWICASIALLATLTLSDDVPTDVVGRYAATMLLAPFGHHIDVVYWTLTVEISFYLLVFLVIRFKGFDTMLRWLLWIGVVSCLFNVMAVIVQAGFAPTSFSSHFSTLWAKHTPRLLLLRHGCFFALGSILWSRLTPHRRRTTSWLAVPLIMGGTCEVYFSARDQALQFPDSQFSLMTPVSAWLIGLSLIYLLSLPAVNARLSTGRLPRTLRVVGLLTFPLYLLHNNIGIFVLDRVMLWAHSKAVATLVAVAVCLLLSYLVSAKIDPRFSAAFRKMLQRSSALLGANGVTAPLWNRIFLRT